MHQLHQTDGALRLDRLGLEVGGSLGIVDLSNYTTEPIISAQTDVQAGVNRVFDPFQEVSPTVLYSPLSFTDDQLGTIDALWLDKASRRSCFIPSAALGEVLKYEGDYDNVFKFDLSVAADFDRLGDVANDLIDSVRKGNTLVILDASEYLFNHHYPDRSSYRIHTILRNVEDSAEGYSVILCAISPGANIPKEPVAPNSPFGFSFRKMFFVSPFGSMSFEPDDSTNRYLLELNKRMKSPAGQLDTIWGSEKRTFYAQCTELVINRSNVLFVGPRRGGKSSFIKISKSFTNQVAKWQYVHGKREDLSSYFKAYAKAVIKYFFQNLNPDDYIVDDPKETAHNIAELFKYFPNEKKRLIIAGDECWDNLADYAVLDGVFELFKFFKECKLPVQLVVAMTDASYELMKNSETYEKNAELSAIHIRENLHPTRAEALEYARHNIGELHICSTEQEVQNLAILIVDTVGPHIWTIYTFLAGFVENLMSISPDETAPNYSKLPRPTEHSIELMMQTWLIHCSPKERYLLACLSVSVEGIVIVDNNSPYCSIAGNLAKKGYAYCEQYGEKTKVTISARAMALFIRKKISHILRHENLDTSGFDDLKSKYIVLKDKRNALIDMLLDSSLSAADKENIEKEEAALALRIKALDPIMMGFLAKGGVKKTSIMDLLNREDELLFSLL